MFMVGYMGSCCRSPTTGDANTPYNSSCANSGATDPALGVLNHTSWLETPLLFDLRVDVAQAEPLQPGSSSHAAALAAVTNATAWMTASLREEGKLLSKPVYRSDLSKAECCNRDNVVCRCKELPSLEAPPSSPPVWAMKSDDAAARSPFITEHGAITAGSDLGRRNSTLAAAEAFCAGHQDCAGFTLRHNGSSAPTTKAAPDERCLGLQGTFVLVTALVVMRLFALCCSLSPLCLGEQTHGHPLTCVYVCPDIGLSLTCVYVCPDICLSDRSANIYDVYFKKAGSVNTDSAWLSWLKRQPNCPSVKLVWQPAHTQINASTAGPKNASAPAQGAASPANRGGLEDGIVVRRADGKLSMVAAEMYAGGWVAMRLGVWESPDGLNWERQRSLRASTGQQNSGPHASSWGPSFVHDPANDTWVRLRHLQCNN